MLPDPPGLWDRPVLSDPRDRPGPLEPLDRPGLWEPQALQEQQEPPDRWARPDLQALPGQQVLPGQRAFPIRLQLERLPRERRERMHLSLTLPARLTTYLILSSPEAPTAHQEFQGPRARPGRMDRLELLDRLELRVYRARPGRLGLLDPPAQSDPPDRRGPLALRALPDRLGPLALLGPPDRLEPLALPGPRALPDRPGPLALSALRALPGPTALPGRPDPPDPPDLQDRPMGWMLMQLYTAQRPKP